MYDRCRECVANNAAKIAKAAGVDEEGCHRLHDRALTLIAHFPSDNDISRAPYAMSEVWADLVDAVGPDPYAEVKATFERLTTSLAPRIRSVVDASDDPAPLAIRFAVAGNLIDVGTPMGFTEDRVAELLDSVPSLAFARDDSPSLIERASTARTIVFLADNCGESALDRILIETLHRLNPSARMVYVVRNNVILNDLTMDEALAAGMDEVADLMTNGDADYGAGTLLDGSLSPEFRHLVETADLVVSKGQGNFETLYGRLHDRLYFLFMAKCQHIADVLGVPMGGLLCLENRV